MKKLFLTILFLLLAVEARAVTYYVDAARFDDNATCVQAQTLATAKKTIAAGLACAGAVGTSDGAGDTVEVVAGTYSLGSGLIDVIPSGTINSPFTLKCATDGACNLSPTSPASAIGMNQSHKHIVIQGFNVITGSGYYSSATAGLCNAGHFDNVQIINNQFDGDLMHESAQAFQGCGKNFVFRGNTVKNLKGYGNGPSDPGKAHGFYVFSNSTGFLIERNVFNDNAAYAVHVYDATSNTNHTIRYNKFARNGTAGVNGGAIIVFGSGHQIYGNVDDNSKATTGTGEGSINVWYTDTASGINIYNNTIYNSAGYGIAIPYGTQVVCKNNLIIGSVGAATQGCDAASNSNNVTTGTAASHFVNAAGGDFTLISSSAAINAGTSVITASVTRPFNGTAPAAGAHEKLGAVSCVVENATPTLMDCTVQNNVNPPILPAASITGWTVTGKTISSNTRSGTNGFQITVTVAFTAGTCALSYAQTGNLTDSALIGNTSNQELFAGAATCTNNVSGGAGATITQSHGAMFAWDGSEGSGAQIGATNPTTPLRAMVFGKYLARFGLKTTVADTPPTNYRLRYSKNDGAYAVVPSFAGAEDVGICDGPAVSASNTIQRLTSGSFVAGRVVEIGAGVPTITMTNGQSTELLYPICYGPNLVSGTDNIKFRLYKDDGTALAYDTNATLNVDVVTPGLSGL